jgi:phage terminase large subunit
MRGARRIGTYWHLLPEGVSGPKADLGRDQPAHRASADRRGLPGSAEQDPPSGYVLEFGNGSTWQVVGSDNYNSLVGSPPVGVVFSEWSLAKPEAWTYMRPSSPRTAAGRSSSGRRGAATTRPSPSTRRKRPELVHAALAGHRDQRLHARTARPGKGRADRRERQRSRRARPSSPKNTWSTSTPRRRAPTTARRSTPLRRGPGHARALRPRAAGRHGVGPRHRRLHRDLVLPAGRPRGSRDRLFRDEGEGLQSIVRDAIATKPYVYGDAPSAARRHGPRARRGGRSGDETLKGLGVNADQRRRRRRTPRSGSTPARQMIPMTWFDAEKCATGAEPAARLPQALEPHDVEPTPARCTTRTATARTRSASSPRTVRA